MLQTQNFQGTSHSISDYDRVGGGPAIRAVVDRFYELVLGTNVSPATSSALTWALVAKSGDEVPLYFY